MSEEINKNKRTSPMSKRKPSIKALTMKKKDLFEDMIRDIDPQDIPSEYIQIVSIKFKNGIYLELPGEDLEIYPEETNINKEQKQKLDEFYTSIEDIKIFVKTEKLRKDINKRIRTLFKAKNITKKE